MTDYSDQGQFYIATDTGGGGVGIVQAAESGVNVARQCLNIFKRERNT